MKKVIALALALVMVLAMGITAFAADTGSITINGATASKEYDLYKIFDLTYVGEGAAKKVAYTVDADWTDFFKAGGDGASYIVDANNAENSLNQIVMDGVTKYINITDANVAAFASAALDYAAAKTADKTVTCPEGSTTVTASDLPLGYYLVYPRGATDIKDTYASICSLTSTIPNGTVNIKANYPVIDKTVDDVEVEIGQEVTYTITGEVPDTTGYESYKYVVKDTMSSGLTFNKNVTVKFGNDTITATPDYDTVTNGFTVEFDMTQYQAYKGQPITITYSAIVNENAVIGVEGNPNKAELTYSNDPSDATKTTTNPPIEVKVYTAKIIINKFDGSDPETKLEGAEFVLKNSAGKYYFWNDTTKKVEWKDTVEEATKKVTDANGFAEFTGIESGTYELVETAAPEGYNLLPNPISVTINSEDVTTGDGTIPAHADQTVDVANNTGSDLPSTGGIGTTIFYIVGSLMMVGAVVFLVVRKKMSTCKN